MYVLITYDIAITTDLGSKRLRKASQACLAYGQRVQNSVYECDINEVQLVQLTHQLEKIINPEIDSVRIYKLTDRNRNEIIHMGIKEPVNFRDPLVF